MVEAYLLYWPEGWKRTDRYRRTNSRFKTGFAVARDQLMDEIRRLGGRQIVLSTNIPLRNDGLPYASAKEPDDTGVAVYFSYKQKSMCFGCDRFHYVKENIQAIAKTIEAIRGIERWGASDMMERAFSARAAAEFLGTSDKHVMRMAREGKLPGHPLGEGIQRRRWRFKLSELDEWMRSRNNAGFHSRRLEEKNS